VARTLLKDRVPVTSRLSMETIVPPTSLVVVL
jgi:hypothetical protein